LEFIEIKFIMGPGCTQSHPWGDARHRKKCLTKEDKVKSYNQI